MHTSSVRLSIRAILIALGAVALMLIGQPAGAVPIPRPPSSPDPGTDANTDLTLTSILKGQGVSGGLAPLGSDFDPLAGYPSDVPAGFELRDEGFAGTIEAQSSLTGEKLQMYCVNIRTNTYVGIGYENSTWEESKVLRLGYVARVLNDNYPNTSQPDAAPDDNARAAAVQAAIWFFSDSYVLSSTDPVRPYTAELVAEALSQGPITEPSPPGLTIQSPTPARGPADAPLGPYEVTSDASATITVTSTDAQMFADAAGTEPIAQDAKVPNGQQIWLRPIGPGASDATLFARAVASVPFANVYVYDNNTPGITAAQTLVLAKSADVTAQVSATAEFYDTGQLRVAKTIAGPAAGRQGEVVIQVTCNEVRLPDLVVPAGFSGTQDFAIDGIETPATCTVAESVDGTNSAVTVVTVNGEQTVDLPQNDEPDDPVDAEPITDTYGLAPGSLVVSKTIAGPAAGRQGAVTLHVSCTDGTSQDVVIPAGTTGETSATISDLPAGTTCTVTEPVDGATSAVAVTISGLGQATVVPGSSASLAVTDRYQAVVPPTPPTPPTPPAPPHPPLPNTGVSDGVLIIAGLAALLMVGGAALRFAGARRRGRSTT